MNLRDVLLATLVASLGAACSCDGGGGGGDAGADAGPGDDAGPPDAGAPDAGTPTDGGALSFRPAANTPAFWSPFDAVPSPDGSKVYFTGVNAKGPGVFTSAATGGTVTEIAAGAPFVAPFGIDISVDGTKLYVADAAAGTGTNDRGEIFSVAAAGGSPAAVNGPTGYAPRGTALVVEGGAETLYFTGTSTVDGKAGLFKVPAAGGTVSAVYKGPPLRDPSGIAVTSNTLDAYVLDLVSATSGAATVYKVSGGTPSVLLGEVGVGYPAGIALSRDDSTLYVSGLDPVTRTDVVYAVNLATQVRTALTAGINTFFEPAGLHRARNADVFAWADSLANSTGTVFVLSK